MSEEIIQVSQLDEDITELAQQIYSETDVNKAKDLVAMFNWNISKKNVTRIKKLNDLYDAVTDQMIERVDKKADQFSNSDLLDYVKVIQGAIDTSTKNLSQIEEPPTIVQHNTQINVNMIDRFDADSKKRVLEAIQQVLQSAQNVSDIQEENSTITTDFVDTTGKETE